MTTAPDARLSRRARAALCLDDFESMARRVLPRALYAYAAGVAETGAAQRWARAAYDAWSLVPRALVDTSGRDASVDFLGTRYAAPFGVAPLGAAGLIGYEAERRLARVAARRGLPMVLSGASLAPMEDVVRDNPDAWFQMYVPADRAVVSGLVERAARAGFRTLVATVDFPAPGNREHYIRAGFDMPLRLGPRLAWQGLTHPRWLFGTLLRGLAARGWPHFENAHATRRAPVFSRSTPLDRGARDRVTFDDMAFIRSLWPGKFLIKGLLRPEDARRAQDIGADAVVVSNHGGRQLDRAVAPLAALAAIAEACPGLPLVIDGAIRRGTDVLIALALGARLALIGRPFLYGAAAAGEDGAARAADLLIAEIDRDMAMLGCRRIGEVTRETIAPSGAGHAGRAY